MQKPKLWFFDIDGTLDEKSFSILKKSNKSLFSFITGRGFLRSKELAERGFPLNTFMILECGGRITDQMGSDLINFPFSKDRAKIAFKIAKDHFSKNNLEYIGFFGMKGHKCFIFCPDTKTEKLLKEKYPTVVGGFAKSLLELEKIFNQKGCVKFTIKLHSGNLRGHKEINCAKNDAEFSITEKGVNKASGILEMSKTLNIPLEEIAVAGNDFNDISMFELPLSVKIAVGNRCEEIIKLSTHHINNKSELPKILKDLL